jgi:TRAP-type transport system periplasmic protein
MKDKKSRILEVFMLKGKKDYLFAGILLILILISCVQIHAQEVILFSGTWNPGQYQVDTMNKFKELFEERSEGRFEVRVLTGMAIGGGREHVEQCQSGDIHLISLGPESIAVFNPSYNIENMHFVFESWDHMWAYHNGEPGKIIEQQVLDSLDIRTLGRQIRGARMLTANKPIYSRDDLQGLQMRLSEAVYLLRVWKALGASPTPVSFAELYSALQTGVVEAQENPIESIYGLSLYEVQDYLMETSHVYSVAYYQVSEKWFKTLSPEDQNLVTECMDEAIEYGTALALELEDEMRNEMVEKGWLTIITEEEMDLDSIREPALEECAKMVEEGLFEKELYDMAIFLKDPENR